MGPEGIKGHKGAPGPPGPPRIGQTPAGNSQNITAWGNAQIEYLFAIMEYHEEQGSDWTTHQSYAGQIENFCKRGFATRASQFFSDCLANENDNGEDANTYEALIKHYKFLVGLWP